MKKLLSIALMLFVTEIVFAQQKNLTKTTTETTSVSINNSDNEYLLIASFNPEKVAIVKSLIIKSLGQSGESMIGETTWSLKNTYTVLLKPEKLSINLYKEKASQSVNKSIIKLGSDIQKAITRTSQTKDK